MTTTTTTTATIDKRYTYIRFNLILISQSWFRNTISDEYLILGLSKTKPNTCCSFVNRKST